MLKTKMPTQSFVVHNRCLLQPIRQEIYTSIKACTKTSHIGKLNSGKLSQIGQAVMSSIFVHDQGDVLHMLGAEPPRHGCCLVVLVVAFEGKDVDGDKNILNARNRFFKWFCDLHVRSFAFCVKLRFEDSSRVKRTRMRNYSSFSRKNR